MKIVLTALFSFLLISSQSVLAEKNSGNTQNFSNQLVMPSELKPSPQSFSSNTSQPVMSAVKEEKGLFDKWWDLSPMNKKMLILLPIGIVIVLWGFFRFVFTGKQFGDNEYTVLEKIQLGANTYAEMRKNNNSGLVFYFTYGPIEKKLRGRISKEVFEELKSKVIAN